MKKVNFLLAICFFLFAFWGVSAQDEDVIYDDTLTKRLFHINKAYKKKSFESTTYTCLLYTSPSPRD